MPYKAKGKCVYKADSGKKVGCTKGPVSKYLAALHANVPDAKNENNSSNTMQNVTNEMAKAATPATDKLVNLLAKKATEWMEYKGTDAPVNIDSYDFADNVMDSPNSKLSPKIVKMWKSLSKKQKYDLYRKVLDVLRAKHDAEYGQPDDMLENKLNEIALRENEKYQKYSEYDIDMNSDYMRDLLDDPRLSREWERSDVSWFEFLLDKGLLRKKR